MPLTQPKLMNQAAKTSTNSAPEGPINVLVIGSGGREHALVWKLSQSPLCGSLYCMPGNGGTAQYARNIPESVLNFEAAGALCLAENITLLVVGPEAPLAAGIADYFAESEGLQHIAVIGPKKAGALLESSKYFSKSFMVRHGIPTAKAADFGVNNLEEGLNYLRSHNLPAVIKADGLAAGKGVIIARNRAQAAETLTEMLSGDLFGAAGHTVLVEEFLDGIEMSLFVLTDGQSYVVLPEAKDYKRIGNGDTGPNTGGMGAVSPVPFYTPELQKKVTERIIEPTLAGLRAEEIPYCGFLFIGLMLVDGEPLVIEYNARLGDPETEAVLPRLESDLLELLLATAQGRLSECTVQASPLSSAAIVLASDGYPETYRPGDLISGLADAGKLRNTHIFHSGTFTDTEGRTTTNGGRVLVANALGDSHYAAMRAARRAAETIKWRGRYFRTDIGEDVWGE